VIFRRHCSQLINKQKENYMKCEVDDCQRRAKTIKYGKNVEKYYFKNEKPSTTDYTKYKIK
jgi:hypothetical protein